MKYNLLGAVSTLALGAALGTGIPGTANATPYTLGSTGLTCTGTTAGSCTETISITASKENFNVGGASQTITLDKWFAPVAGDKLTEVTYVGGGGVSSHGTLTNTGSANAHGQDTVQMSLTLAPGTAPSNFLVPTLSFTNTGRSANTTLAPGASKAYTLSKGLGPSSAVNLNSNLSGYIGTGPSPGTYTALATSLSNGGALASPATFSASQNIFETAFVTVTYDFSSPSPPPPPGVPEPASIALLGAGLAGLGAIRRRRKS